MSLTRSAAQLRSPFLSVAALKVRAAEDHFVKVRQIIKDLLERLNDQASDEEDHKTFCDRETSNAVEKRDQQQMTVEDLKAQIDQKESSKVQLKSEIAELSKQIAANKKALNEATQLRQEENADNTKTVEEAGSGLASVEFAITRLNEFYQGQQAAMIQRSGYVPPDSDREGLTVREWLSICGVCHHPIERVLPGSAGSDDSEIRVRAAGLRQGGLDCWRPCTRCFRFRVQRQPGGVQGNNWDFGGDPLRFRTHRNSCVSARN